MDTGRHRVHRLCVAVDMHYLESVGVPAATVVAADAAFGDGQAGIGAQSFHVSPGAQVGLAELVTPVMLEVLATPGLLDFNQVLSGLVGIV